MIGAGQRQPILIAMRPVDFRCGQSGGSENDPVDRFPDERAGADRADRTEAGPAFRGDDRVPFETRRQAEGFGLGRNRSCDGLQSFGTRQLCLG